MLTLCVAPATAGQGGVVHAVIEHLVYLPTYSYVLAHGAPQVHRPRARARSLALTRACSVPSPPPPLVVDLAIHIARVSRAATASAAAAGLLHDAILLLWNFSSGCGARRWCSPT